MMLCWHSGVNSISLLFSPGILRCGHLRYSFWNDVHVTRSAVKTLLPPSQVGNHGVSICVVIVAPARAAQKCYMLWAGGLAERPPREQSRRHAKKDEKQAIVMQAM